MTPRPNAQLLDVLKAARSRAAALAGHAVVTVRKNYRTGQFEIYEVDTVVWGRTPDADTIIWGN